VFRKESLFDGLKHITTNNSQNEYYLTDVFDYFGQHQWKVSALLADDEREIHGINTVEQLDWTRGIMESRLASPANI
jgi:bifunctional N-acetylglucosamine-1-phosphate-uridyltransferase/glucosamine-1-phosphate-acetyltransferase GlmU-like protein